MGNYEISLGKCIQKKIKISNDDIIFFEQLKGFKRFTSNSIVDEQLTIIKVFEQVIYDLFQAPVRLIQQEIIFLMPIYKDDWFDICAELIDFDQKQIWVTISIECKNNNNQTLLSGQMVVECMKKGIKN